MSDDIYLKHAFLALRQYARDHHDDQAKPGLGGSWTAEERRGDGVVSYMMGDGGYSGIVMSQKYNLRITFDCTYQFGDRYQLRSGTMDKVGYLLKELDLDIEPAINAELNAAPSRSTAPKP